MGRHPKPRKWVPPVRRAYKLVDTDGGDVTDQIDISSVEVESVTYNKLQNNEDSPKGETPRRLPIPLIIAVKLNGFACKAMIDSGSLTDFISSRLADLLDLKRQMYGEAIKVSLTVRGSETKINAGVTARLTYQEIAEDRYFDIMNAANYDVVLGTPWLQWGQVLSLCLGIDC